MPNQEKPQDFELIGLLIREAVEASLSDFESFKARFQSYIDQISSYLHSVSKEGFFPHFFLGSFSTFVDTEIAKKLDIKKIYFKFDDSKTLKVAVIRKGDIINQKSAIEKVNLFVISESGKIDSKSKKFTYGELEEILGQSNLPAQNEHVKSTRDDLKVKLVKIVKTTGEISVEVKDDKLDKNIFTAHEFKEIKKGLWSNSESDVAKLTNSDVEKVKKSVENILKKVSKIHSKYKDSLIYTDKAREAAHHGFIAGTLVNFRYRHNLRVYLEQFAERGFVDIILLPRGKDRSLNVIPIIIEIKAATKTELKKGKIGEKSKTTPAVALKQAEGYTKGFQPNIMRVLTTANDILCVGINLDHPSPISSIEAKQRNQEVTSLFNEILISIDGRNNGRINEEGLKEKVQNNIERIYQTFPGTGESRDNHYFSRFLLGQSLLLNEVQALESNFEKHVFIYGENIPTEAQPEPKSQRLKDKKSKGQDAGQSSKLDKNYGVATMVFIPENDQKLVYVVNIVETDERTKVLKKGIPLDQLKQKVGNRKIVELELNFNINEKSNFKKYFSMEVSEPISLKQYNNKKTDKFEGRFENVPYPSGLKEAFDELLESQYIDQSVLEASDPEKLKEILNKIRNKYQELLEKVGEGMFPSKSLVKKEAHTQAVLHGAFSHYSDIKLGELQENRALVLTEFQTGRGKHIDMLVHGIKFAEVASNAKEYCPVGIEIKGPREGKGAVGLLKEADNQIEKEYKKGITYKTLTDGDKIFIMGVVFDNKAQSSNSLIKITNKLFPVNVIHSSKVKGNIDKLERPALHKLFNRGLNALRSFKVHSGGFIPDWVYIEKDRLKDSNKDLVSYSSPIFFKKNSDFRSYLDQIPEDISALDLSEMDLDNSKMKILSNFLSKRKNINSIDLSYNRLNSVQVSGLVSFLIRNNRKISFLDLSQNDIGSNGSGSEAIESLAKLIETNNIDNLIISNIEMTSDDFSKIFRALKKNISIKNLDCSFNKVVGGFNKDNVKTIVDFLYNSLKLTALSLANTGINDCTIKDIEEKAQKDYQGKTIFIEELDIGNYDTEEKRITKEGAKSLAKLLKQVSKLKSLKLSGNPIGVEGLKELVSALKIRNTDIETLDISEISLECNQDNAESIADIMKSLIGELNIRELNLADNQLNAKAIGEIFSSMKNRKEQVLKKLNLAGNRIGDEVDYRTLEAISSGLQGNDVLESLNLANMDLSGADIEEIVGALKKESIIDLDISGNDIYGSTMRELSEFLQDNSRLRFLNIANYDLKKIPLPEGIENLFRTLKDHNKVLTHLNIGGYAFSDESVNIIPKYLNANIGIQYLSLAGSEFTGDRERALNVLFEALKQSNLQAMDIRDVSITDKVADKIIEYLKVNKDLQVLHISQGQLSKNQVEKLERASSKILIEVELRFNPINAGCPQRVIREIGNILCVDSRDEEKVTEKEKKQRIKELFGIDNVEIEAYGNEIIAVDSKQVYAIINNIKVHKTEVYVTVRDNSGNDKKLTIDNIAKMLSIENYMVVNNNDNYEFWLRDGSKYYVITEKVEGQDIEYYLDIDGYKVKLDSIIKDFTTDAEKKAIHDKLHQLSNEIELLENKKYIEDVGSIKIANQNYDNVISEIKRNLLEKGVRENTFNQFENHFSDINKKVFAKYIDDVRKNLERRGIEFDHNKFDSAKIKGAKSGKFFSLMAIYDLFDSISDATTLGRHDNDALKQVFGINGILDAMDDVRESMSISHNRKIGKLVSKIPQPIRQVFIKVISNPVVQGITFATIAYQFGYSVDEIAKGNHHPLNYYWAASSGVKLASMSIKPISIGISSTMKGVSATTKILRGLFAASKVLSKVAAVTMVADILITIGIEIHERVKYTKAIAEQIPLLPGNEQAEVFFAKVIRFFTGRDVEKEYEDKIRVKSYLNHVKEVAIQLLNDNYNIAAVVQYVTFIEEKYGEVIRSVGAKPTCFMVSPYGPGCATRMMWMCELEKKYNNISFDKINAASNIKNDLSLLNISKALEMRPYTLVMSEGWERFICNVKSSSQCYQDIDQKEVYIVNTDAKHIPHLTKYEYETLGLRIVDAPLGKPIQKSQCSKIINTQHTHGGDVYYLCNTDKTYKECQESFTLSGEPFIFTNPTRKSSNSKKEKMFPKDSVLYISGPKTLTAAANYPAVMHISEGSNIRYIGSKNNETIFIVNNSISGALEGGAGKENTLVMNVKANNVVVDLHEGVIHYGSNNIKLVNTYNYVSNSDSKQNITTHCKTRLINVKNTEVHQGSFDCQDQDYEVRVVNKENVHYRGLKQTIFIVNDNSDNAKIVSDLSDTGKENFDVIDVQGANITQLEISEDIGKGGHSLNLLADDMESIVSSTKIDDFKNLVIQVKYQGITESVVIQDKSLSDIVKDIWYQKLNGLGKGIDGEVVQNGEKKLKAFIQVNILNLELPNAYQITKDIANNNNLNIPVSKIEVTKNYMGIPAEKVIIGGVYSDQIIVDFSYNNSDFASSYQRYHDNRGKYDYNRYMIECNHYQDIIVEGGKGQYQYIIKLPEYNHTLEYDPLSSPIRLNLKIKNRTVLHQSIPYDIIDFAELNVMDINSINIREGERNYINECYNKPISDLTEDSLEIQNITILDSKGIRWSLSIGLIDYLKSPEHQYIILRINNKFYKIDSANLELKHIETNPNFFRYYKPDEQGLQIYHNQPINNNDIGLVDFRDKSILGFDAEVINDSLVLLHKNNTLIKVENWNTYQPAREMIFAFNDTILSNSKCIISTCNSEDIIGDLNKEKVVVLKNQMFNAIVQNNISEAEDLIRRIGNIDTENKHELTPLYVAIQEGRLDVVKLLFNRGSVNVKDKDIHGCNSLHWAAQEGKLNIAKLLVDKGANIIAEDNNGRTPLRVAACNGNLDMVKFFLNKSVDIESESNDPDKMMRKIKSVRKEIINQVDASSNVKKWAKSFIEELRYSIKSKAKRKLDGNISSNCSASTTELTNRIYNFDKNLFDNIIKEVVDDAYGRVDTKKILSCVRSHGYIGQLISGYIAVFDAMQKSGDLNDNAIFKLAYYIKKAMEMKNDPNVPLEKRSSLEKLENRLPKSVRNAIFASKVCIKNVYQDEYLYAANKCFNYDNDRRMAFTWTPKNEENDKFRWRIKPDGNNFYIVNVAFNETLYAASNYFNYDNDRRMVFTWISGGRVARDVWKLGPDGDNCSIMNVKLNEYLYAANYAKYDNDRRRVFTWIPGGQVSQGMWMIEDCGSNVRRVRDIVSNAKGELDQELLDAAKVGDMNKVKDSVNRGADVNTKDRDGNTPSRNAVLKGHFGIFKYLVENGVSLEGKDHRCGPSICDASYSGNLDILKYLIGKGVDVNESDKNGWTPLHFAAWRGYLEVANFLIEKGANINVGNIFDRKPIHIAAKNNNKNIIEFFLSKGMSIDDTDRDGRTPLYYASWNGHLDMVKYLVDKGADIYIQDKGGKTSLAAAIDQKHDDIVKYLNQVQLDRELLIVAQYGNLNEVKDLVSQKASLSARYSDGWTLIHCAAYGGKLDIVKYFVDEEKIDASIKDNSGWTPLHWASWNGHLDVVEYLIRKGANINAADNSGKKPLHVAAESNNKNIIEFLLSKGENVNDCGDDYWRPLHYAAKAGSLEAAKFLVEKGAGFYSKKYETTDGQAPIHIAAYYGHKNIVKFFVVEKGVDVNWQDGYRSHGNWWTPLHWASKGGRLDVVEYLVSLRASIDARDWYSKTPIDIARDNGHNNVINYLEKELNQERGSPAQRKRRHHHGDHSRHHNHLSRKPLAIDSSNQPEIAASSGTRPSSWINGLFGWVKGSVGGLFYSRAALSEEASNTASSIPQVDEQFAKASVSSSSSTSTTLPSDGTDKKQENGGFFRDNIDYVNTNIKQMRERQTPVKFKPSGGNTILEMGDHYLSQVDFNGAIMLLDLLIRKVTGQKYISTVDQSISPLEAQGYVLNITEEFEKVVEQAGLKSDVSMHRLNIDYMEMQKEITRKVMSGKFNEISGILKSYVEKACPDEEAGKLSPKKFEKFIAQFNKGLLNQSIEQILHNRDGRLEVDDAKKQQMSLEPQSYLSNASVHSHSKVSTCLSEIGVTKLGGNINR